VTKEPGLKNVCVVRWDTARSCTLAKHITQENEPKGYGEKEKCSAA